MAAAGNLTLAANVVGGSDGARSFGPLVITTNAAVIQTLTVALTNGANTITIPTGATCVVLLPPNAPSSTSVGSQTFSGTLTLKGVSGDTGSAISNKWPTMLAFDTAPASLVVNSTATGSLVAWFM
jgi:hypothetical protein